MSATTKAILTNREIMGSFTGSYMATNVPGHAVVMLKIVSTP